MDEDNETSARSQQLPTLGSLPQCPDCGVAIGKAHISYDYDGCDIARCLVTGLPRLSCTRNHDHGRDVWSGWWPGDLDCEYLGWMLGPGLPDLNRLYAEAVWDRERCLWVKPT
jgi:hypothetical protein